MRAVRYLVLTAEQPPQWSEIVEARSATGKVSHSASMSVASVNDPFAGDYSGVVALIRGHGVLVRYEGLSAV